MKHLKSNFILALCSIVTLLAVPALSKAQTSASSSNLSYDQMFPLYAEFCSVTKLIPLSGDGEGGFAGHSVLYIKGICRDKTAGYPRVKVCPPSVNLTDPESGTGISVDGVFDNVVWMATDGKKDFFSGSLSANARLNADQQKAVERSLLKKGYFKGIQLTPKNMMSKPDQISTEEYVAHLAIGTDLALDFGRNAYCARLPLNSQMLPLMVQYLNSRNEEYYNTGKHYVWNRLWDNCAHLAHNTFAAAGIVPVKKLNMGADQANIYGDIPENEPKTTPFALPGRSFAQFIQLGTQGGTKVEDIYDNPLTRRLFNQLNWVATQPGALFVYRPIRSAPNNEMYDSTYQTPENLWSGGMGSTIRQIRQEPRFTDLKANLIWFKEKYQEDLEAYEILPGTLSGVLRMRNSDFAQFYAGYGAYLREQLRRIDQLIPQLSNQQ
jgi:hypothetical protein